MKRIVLLVAILSLALPPAISLAASAEDPLFRAMEDELHRSMTELVLPGMSHPFFLSYRVRDEEVLRVEARYTALVASDRTRDRQLAIDLRVGNPGLDNTNFYQDWRDLWASSTDLVLENSYDALRHQIWYQTDAVYKRALESLARKTAYLQAHPSRDSLPDFGAADPFVYLGAPSGLSLSQSEAEQAVRAGAGAFRSYPSLEDWRVALEARSVNQWYLNSEGARHRVPRSGNMLDMSATLQAPDGQRLTGFVSKLVMRGDGLPPANDIAQEARRLSEDLEAMAAAPALEEYVGPVLFTESAAAQFFSQLLAEQLSLSRKALVTEEWMSSWLSLGKLAGKTRRRILPTFVTVRDQPRLEAWGGVRLAGAHLVDDEGVQCQDITLVENGRLINLPLDRQPLRDFPKSNGHAWALTQQRAAPGITNLMVSSSDPWAMEKMLRELRRLCREQGQEFGLLVKRLEDNRFSSLYRTVDRQETEPEVLAPPLFAYKVYAKDGRVEPVRGLSFEDVSIRTLRDIVALGTDTQVHNILQPGPMEGAYQPASIITPSILVEEMELKAAGVREPLPVAARPD